MKHLGHDRPRNPESGFGLIESLVSLLLVVVSSVGSVALITNNISTTAFAGSAQAAVRVGQEVVDRALAEPFATLGNAGSVCPATAPAGFAFPNVYAGGAAAPSPGNTTFFQRTCSVTVLGDGMKVITVPVTWRERTGKQRTITVGVQRAP